MSLQNIAAKILKWYKKNKRDLPWRKTNDPYKIWVSEIMLQQTQVSRVIGYYERFLIRFPKVQDLAQATWEEFLPYWQGLGFYSRGRNMLKAAQIIDQTFTGKFPQTKAKLESLPGIAQYTSAAIRSFAYRHAVPALDTNLIRIFQRVCGCTEKGVLSRATTLFEEHKISADLLNHAFMDLGSSLCKSRKTQCEMCPLQQECHFLKSGKKEEWERSLLKAPQKNMHSTKIPMEVAVACIHQNGKYLIAQRSKEKGLNWEFPGGKREKGEDWRHCLQREIQEELDIEISVRPHFFEETWEEKEFFWRIRFFRCQILKGTPKALEHKRLQWVSPQQLLTVDFPQANAKALQKLCKMKFPQ